MGEVAKGELNRLHQAFVNMQQGGSKVTDY